jgi:hypothetical protein
VIFWGTNLFGDFGWTGGSYLRQAWLATSVIGICLLRRGFAVGAGAMLVTSALLRIFPGVILATLALRAVMRMRAAGRWRLEADELRIGAGALLASLVIFGASLAASGGISSWGDFVTNSRTHLATPLKNHVGWKTLLAHDSEASDRLVRGGTVIERYERWAEARREGARGTAFFHTAGVAVFVLLLALAVRDQPLWVAAILGVGLIPVAFELTNYYYAILLCYGLLVDRWASAGPMLLGVSTASWVISGRLQWTDEIMVTASLAVLLLVLHCTLQPLVSAAPARDPAGG